MQNHFALFNLPAEFALDSVQLDAAYREVQNKVHPDKFVSAPDAEKRVAMQSTGETGSLILSRLRQTGKHSLNKIGHMTHGFDGGLMTIYSTMQLYKQL